MQKERIDFIDLAKGFCIILVVMGHCDVANSIPGFNFLRMPLFFILSGLFFKPYNGFLNFAIQKTNKILIPFLFFYCISYFLFYLIEAFYPAIMVTSARGIEDMFTNRQFFNGPIWFLLCLYWGNLLFYIVYISFKKEVFRTLSVLIIGFIGFYLGYKDFFLPLFIDVAFTALPFYYIGYLLKKSPILYPSKYDRWSFIFIFFLYGISAILEHSFSMKLLFQYNDIKGCMLPYIAAICSVLVILLLCKKIKKIAFISYIGRYSIVVLCLHHLVYRPLKVLFKLFDISFLNNSYTLFIITLIICYFLIPLCIKYIPYFTAQKNLIKPPPPKKMDS